MDQSFGVQNDSIAAIMTSVHNQSSCILPVYCQYTASITGMSVPHLVLLLVGASALGCPGSDWAEAGASCYHRSSRPLSWREGNDYCQQQGGYVVEVKICNGFHIRRCKNNQMYRNQV